MNAHDHDSAADVAAGVALGRAARAAVRAARTVGVGHVDAAVALSAVAAVPLVALYATYAPPGSHPAGGPLLAAVAAAAPAARAVVDARAARRDLDAGAPVAAVHARADRPYPLRVVVAIAVVVVVALGGEAMAEALTAGWVLAHATALGAWAAVRAVAERAAHLDELPAGPRRLRRRAPAPTGA